MSYDDQTVDRPNWNALRERHPMTDDIAEAIRDDVPDWVIDMIGDPQDDDGHNMVYLAAIDAEVAELDWKNPVMTAETYQTAAEKYRGEWESAGDYTENFHVDVGDISRDDWAFMHVNWERATFELSVNEVAFVETPAGTVYVFQRH